MKRTVCMILALLLVCLSVAAVAEGADPVPREVIKAFEDTWVSETSEGYATEIWYDDDAFHCRGTRFITVDDGYTWEFDSCAYDAGTRTLVCEGGVLVHDVRNATTDLYDSEEVASGFGAMLTVDENHRLHWTGSGDAIPDQVFASLDEVGEEEWADGDDEDDSDDPFVGDWMCERASIYIDEDDAVYTVFITWGSSAFEEVVWEYTCTLDSATGALKGVGKKSDETYDEAGEFVSSQEEYSDGAATFTIDGDVLIWDDAKEDAGQGMRFERSEPEGDAEEDFDYDEDDAEEDDG